MLTFSELEQKYGPAAYGLLVEIEKAAKIPSWKVYSMDCETRLANSILAQEARYNGAFAESST